MSASKRINYSQEDVKNALEAIKIGMSVRAASLKFKIPRSTLTAKKYAKYANKKPGPPTVLSQHEETVLVNWILERSKIAVPVTKDQLLNSVKHLVSDRVNPFKDNKPGLHWYRSFMRRHSQLKERVKENLSVSRSKVTENAIRAWFGETSKCLKTNNLSDVEPTRIFNVNETALLLSPEFNGSATVADVQNDEKESLTTLIMGNAAGQIAPPLILFKYQKIPAHIINKIPKEWGIGVSDNGWMTGENFFEYIVNIFYPWLLKGNIKLPIILYIDGTVSYLTQPLTVFCVEHQIILIPLHPNSAHILQPLDVSMSRPLKAEYEKVVEHYCMEYDYIGVHKEDFAHLLKKALNNMDCKKILENGFRTCGLYPFNVNAINYTKLSNRRASAASDALETADKQNCFTLH